jgi:hypothetical protein
MNKMANKLQCIVSGKTVLLADSYFQSKVDKAGSEDKLRETYISREAKKLLKVGNSIEKVRELLDAPKDLPDVDAEFVMNLVFGSNTKAKFKTDINTDFTALSSITHSKTDPDVKKFINKIKV